MTQIVASDLIHNEIIQKKHFGFNFFHPEIVFLNEEKHIFVEVYILKWFINSLYRSFTLSMHPPFFYNSFILVSCAANLGAEGHGRFDHTFLYFF